MKICQPKFWIDLLVSFLCICGQAFKVICRTICRILVQHFVTLLASVIAFALALPVPEVSKANSWMVRIAYKKVSIAWIIDLVLQQRISERQILQLLFFHLPGNGSCRVRRPFPKSWDLSQCLHSFHRKMERKSVAAEDGIRRCHIGEKSNPDCNGNACWDTWSFWSRIGRRDENSKALGV